MASVDGDIVKAVRDELVEISQKSAKSAAKSCRVQGRDRRLVKS